MKPYKTSYISKRGVKRFSVTVPYPTEPDPNSAYWHDKLAAVMAELSKNPILVQIWDSNLVPEHTTFKEHAQIARRLIECTEEIFTIENLRAADTR